MLQKPPRFFYLQTEIAGNIMNLLQMDGKKLARRANKYVTRDNIVAKKEKICYL